MSKYKQRWWLLLTTLVITTAYANPVEDLLNEVYITTGTDPKVVQTQARGAIIGGSFQARAPVRQINLVNFAAPRYNAGCGGVDLFAGSFSFINAEQFVETLRAIGANALGLAFQLGLKIISETLGDEISKMQQTVQELNQMFRNTCQVARSAMNGELVEEVAAKWSAIRDVWTGEAEDVQAADRERFEDPRMQPEDRENPYVGNMTWIALTREEGVLNDEKLPVLTLVSDKNRMREYIMSMIGTMVYPADGRGDPEDRTAAAPTPYAPVLDLEHFRSTFATPPSIDENPDARPRVEGAYFYRCADGYEHCEQLVLERFDFAGFEELAGRNINQIIDAILNGDDLIDDPQVAAFLNATPFPVLEIMQRFSYDPVTMEFLGSAMAPMIADQWLMLLGTEVHRAARMAFNNISQAHLPDNVKDGIQDLANQVMALRVRSQNTLEQFNMLMETVERIQDREQQINPSALPTLRSGG